MPRPGWRLLHLLALATLAITQPLLGILGDNPTFFTAHDASTTQIIVLTLVIALAPTAVLGAIELGLHAIRPELGRRAHTVLLGALAFLFLIQVVDVLPGPWVVPFVLAGIGAAGLVMLYRRHEAIRSAASVLALSPLLFVGFFLFASSASSVVFPDDVDAVELADLLDGDALAPVDDESSPVGPAPTLEQRLNQRFPPIYMLILDELPMASLLDETGEVDAARWPNFARLAETSHLFSNATTIGYTTERAVPAMLTGRYASAPAPVYSLFPENLFTLLGDIYDATSLDPLVDLCPPSVCNGAPPQAIVDLLATDEADETDDDPDTTSTTRPAATVPEPASPHDEQGSFRVLFDDTLIVFGHLATPDGLDIGLPSIGATWGNFGGDQGLDVTSSTTTTTTTTPASTTTTTPLTVDVGRVPDDDVVDVDPEAIREAQIEFLDNLLIDDARVAEFRADVAAISASDTPRLHVLHTLLPHVPWRLHPDGTTYTDLALPGYFTMWNDDLATAQAAQQRHLLQLGFVDLLLGEYLDELEREGIFDDATIIVVADHGISFVPGAPSRGTGEGNIGGTAGVPLFYKLPGQTDGERHHKPVETIDIVPTIATQLDIALPWAVDGVDLFGPEIERDRAIWHPWSADIPEPYQPEMDAVTEDLLATFGNGSTGSIYALAGLADRIGEPVTELIDAPTSYCWVREEPTAVPEPDGEIGFVGGYLTSRADGRIAIAVTIGDTLSGTSRSLPAERPHRVLAIGDPRVWTDATVDDIGLHEIVDGRLRPISRC